MARDTVSSADDGRIPPPLERRGHPTPILGENGASGDGYPRHCFAPQADKARWVLF
jgi:hypothetical protein